MIEHIAIQHRVQHTAIQHTTIQNTTITMQYNVQYNIKYTTIQLYNIQYNIQQYKIQQYNNRKYNNITIQQYNNTKYNNITIQSTGTSDSCPLCNQAPHDTVHFFNCPVKPTALQPIDQWLNSITTADFLGLPTTWHQTTYIHNYNELYSSLLHLIYTEKYRHKTYIHTEASGDNSRTTTTTAKYNNLLLVSKKYLNFFFFINLFVCWKE